MNNYLVRVQKNPENYYHTVICANDLKEACRLAGKLAERLKITRKYCISPAESYRLVEYLVEGSIDADEYYSSVKHNYQYTDEYADCYAYVVSEI